METAERKWYMLNSLKEAIELGCFKEGHPYFDGLVVIHPTERRTTYLFRVSSTYNEKLRYEVEVSYTPPRNWAENGNAKETTRLIAGEESFLISRQYYEEITGPWNEEIKSILERVCIESREEIEKVKNREKEEERATYEKCIEARNNELRRLLEIWENN